MRLSIFIFCSILLVLFSSGCANFPKKDDSMSKAPGGLEPSAMIKFSDVPVPLGFKIMPQNSYSFESSGVRVGVLKYVGKATPDQVISFYKEQMPMYNWSLLNVIEYGDRIMNFERENETCILGLSPKGRSVILTVSLGPRPQISKRLNKPIK